MFTSSSLKSRLAVTAFSFLFAAAVISGCTVSAKNSGTSGAAESAKEVSAEKTTKTAADLTKNSSGKNRIQINAGSPADAVRLFYKNLREKRFREAMLLTNLRPAVENLSEAEMQDLRTDFDALSSQIPADIEINGEIVTNNLATVTAKLPDENGKLALKEHQLRRENNAWVILTADETEEATAKKEGKNYFFALRIATHENEVQGIMENIAKVQMAYAMQNSGNYADLQTLITKNFLSPDVQQPQSTGYNLSITPSDDKKKYLATAEPAVYGKSGKLSFLLEGDAAGKPRLKFEDNKGKPLKK